nr:tetratricopeptide repeat protein [Lysobacter sp. CAU 1642]
MLAELRRRNVFRAGLAWLALGWLLIIVANLLFPLLGLPERAVRNLALALLALWPLVLWLSWRYELTAQGLRRDAGAGAANPVSRRTARRLDQLTVALVLMALALSGLRHFVLDRAEPRGEAATGRALPVGEAAVDSERPPAVPADPRSLAVLAFANLSPDPSNAYLAEGIAEEILNVLARIDGLRVASRTSSFALRAQSHSAREIGRQLGVAHVLDGSLRRQDDRVRVSVQLIDAATDQPLWSDSFDRELTDIFALQEEIAQAVADALAEPLGVQTVRVRRATDDLEAYSLYLRGRQLFTQRGASLEPARSLLEQSVQRDPQFAEAWAALAATLYVMPSYYPDAAQTSFEQADDASARALDLLPDLAEALAVRSRIAADAGRRDEARALLERALTLEPNNANSRMWLGLTHLEAGHVDAAAEAFAESHRLDPLSGIHVGWLGATELIHGELAGAREHLERGHALGWRGPASAWLLKLALHGSDAEETARRFQDWLRDDGRIPEAVRAVHHAVAPAITDPAQRPAALATLRQAVEQQPGYDWTTLMLFAGLTDAAIEEALRPKPASGQILLMMIWSPVDADFRAHPRFAEIAQRHGLPAYWAEHGAPDGCQWHGSPDPRLECGQ